MADKKTSVSDPHDDTLSLSDNAIGQCSVIDMEHYKATVPLWKRVWQHSLTQMILLSIQAFCGPAMADAITGENDSPLHSGMEVLLMFCRPRWWWSCLCSGVKHLDGNHICHAGNRYVFSLPKITI